MSNALGIYLLSLCRERRVSRRRASLDAGLHNAAISAISRSAAVHPGAETLNALAGYFKVPAENLFRLAGYLEPADRAEGEAAEALQLLRQLPEYRRKEAIAQLRLQVQFAQERGEIRLLGGKEDADVAK
jgi:transcriptional regulator with XRE-family HTH domain